MEDLENDLPEGSCKPNRHGIPTLPIGRTKTVRWPVLDFRLSPQHPAGSLLPCYKAVRSSRKSRQQNAGLNVQPMFPQCCDIERF